MKRAITDYFQASSRAPAGKVLKSSDVTTPPQSQTRRLPSDTDALLVLERTTMGPSWQAALEPEFTKTYFLGLKRFLEALNKQHKQVFPPPQDIYSWSRYTALEDVKVIILGQDPYHNVGQAHGLAFSVAPPTRPPPSLVNIFKELATCYPGFKPPVSGSLVGWAEQGVLLLNACLTVTAHQANSHAGRGWERFTEQVVREVLRRNPHVVIMAWGSPAAKRVAQVAPGKQHLVLRSVHPSPLSASRGWFGSRHFLQANEFLEQNGISTVDWTQTSSAQKPSSPSSPPAEPEPTKQFSGPVPTEPGTVDASAEINESTFIYEKIEQLESPNITTEAPKVEVGIGRD